MQRAVPHNDVSHNQITINKITNIFVVLFVVLSCRIGMEAQHAAPLHALSIVHRPLMKSVPNELSILNFSVSFFSLLC